MNFVSASPLPIEPADIPVDAVRETLERVLNDPVFARNANCSRILRFIVEETIAGRGERLKAFSIATLALNRGEDFNPQANSIVRVQARRLRELLASYYADAGAHDAIVIHLAVGNYQPQFIRRPQPRPQPQIPAAPGSSEPLAPEPSQDRGFRLSRILACAGLLLFALVLLAIHEALSHEIWNSDPVVAVAAPEFESVEPEPIDLPFTFTTKLRAALAAFDHIQVGPRRADRHGPSRIDYTVRSRFFHGAKPGWYFALTLIREPSGDVVWARQFETAGGASPTSVADALDMAARSIADVGVGAVFKDIRARLAANPGPLTGYRCYLEGQAFIRDRAPQQEKIARDCLETALKENPRDVPALATLATQLIYKYLETGDERLLTRATGLAQRAAKLDPHRGDTASAMFLVDFYSGHFDQGFRYAEAAMKLNPNATLTATEIAKAYIARGRYQEGLALMRPLLNLSGVSFAAGAASLAVAARMTGLDDDAYRYATRVGNSETPLGLLTRIVTCHQRGESTCAASAIARLRSRFPEFAQDVSGALQRREMIDEIRSKLLRDLEDAGYFATAQN